MMTSNHPSANDDVKRVNYTLIQMLVMVRNEHQNDWTVHLLRVEYTYNNYVYMSTGLASNEVYIGRLSRFLLAFLSPSLFDQTVLLIRASTPTSSSITISPVSANKVFTNFCVNNTPSPSLV